MAAGGGGTARAACWLHWEDQTRYPELRASIPGVIGRVVDQIHNTAATSTCTLGYLLKRFASTDSCVSSVKTQKQRCQIFLVQFFWTSQDKNSIRYYHHFGVYQSFVEIAQILAPQTIVFFCFFNDPVFWLSIKFARWRYLDGVTRLESGIWIWWRLWRTLTGSTELRSPPPL